MEVDRAGQKQKNAQQEAHNEAEKIKIRPGHGTPRAHFVRELEFETQALLGATSTVPGLTPLSCAEKQTAADDRYPSVPRSDDCRGAKLLRGARPNRASGEFPPGAKWPGVNLHAPRWREAHAEGPDRP